MPSLDDLLKNHPIGSLIKDTIRALAVAEDFTEADSSQESKRAYFARDMHDIFHEIALKPPRLDISSPLNGTLIQCVRDPYRVVSSMVRYLGTYRGLGGLQRG